MKSIKYYTNLVLFLGTSFFCQASQLDIHHIGVGQGDATLFVFTYDDGTTVNILIDTGNSSKKGTEVFKYLVDAIPADKRAIHCLITSHLHSDHYGGTPTLIDSLSTNGWPVLRIIDRGGSYTPPHADVLCYSGGGEDATNDPTPPVNAEPTTNMYNRYVAACSKYPGARQTLVPGTDLFRDVLGINGGLFQFWCLAVNACVLDNYGTFTSTCYPPNNENDLSFAWLVQYEGFKYFTGGDIGGAEPYLDLEDDLCNSFLNWPGADNFHFCSFKVSHHGSAHSTNADFLSTGCGNPTLAIVPSALRSFSGTQIPTQGTLQRIEGVGAKLLYTFIKGPGENYYSGAVNQYNHVVLSVTNPGFGNPIPMTIQQAKVDKGSLEVVEVWGGQTITCTKNHALPAAEKEVVVASDAHHHSDSFSECYQPTVSAAVLIDANLKDRKVYKKLKRLERKERRMLQKVEKCQSRIAEKVAKEKEKLVVNENS